MSIAPPEIVPLGASTLNRDWRLEIDTGAPGSGSATATAASASLVQATHGLSVGQEVVVSTAVAPFVAGTTYYVSAAGFAEGTFQLAATPGGTPITASASGPLGYETVGGPIWTAVRGLREFKPSLAAALQEDSDFDSGGYKSSTKTAVGWSLETKVARKVTADAVPAYDPGQEKLRLAADQNGPANTVHVRWYKVGAVRTEAYEGYAAAEWAPDGGGMDALDTASVKLTGQGKRQPIAHPYTG